MRNIIYIFLVFVLVFFLNLLLYIYVDSYRNFIKTLKYGSDSIPSELSVDDSYNVNSIEYSDSTTTEAERSLLLDLWIEDDAQTSIVVENTPSDTSASTVIRPDSVSQVAVAEEDKETQIEETIIDDINFSWELRFTIVSEEIVSKFQESWFELLEKEERDDLLDVAREYPDDYIQYGNNNFDLYILSTRTYSQVENLFRVLEDEMPFTLNKTDSFWESSFFINLDRPDQKVRFVFEYKWEVYWVKVRTPNYNAVRSVLNTL